MGSAFPGRVRTRRSPRGGGFLTLMVSRRGEAIGGGLAGAGPAEGSGPLWGSGPASALCGCGQAGHPPGSEPHLLPVEKEEGSGGGWGRPQCLRSVCLWYPGEPRCAGPLRAGRQSEPGRAAGFLCVHAFQATGLLGTAPRGGNREASVSSILFSVSLSVVFRSRSRWFQLDSENTGSPKLD